MGCYQLTLLVSISSSWNKGADGREGDARHGCYRPSGPHHPVTKSSQTKINPPLSKYILKIQVTVTAKWLWCREKNSPCSIPSFLCDWLGKSLQGLNTGWGPGARGAWWVIHLKQHHYMFPKPGPLQAVFPQTCDLVWGYRSDLSLGYSGLDTWNVFANLNSEHLIKTSLENKTSIKTLLMLTPIQIQRDDMFRRMKQGKLWTSVPWPSGGVHGQPDLSAAIPVALQRRLARKAKRLFSGTKPGPKQLGFSQLTSSVSWSSVMTTGMAQNFSSNQKNKNGK